MKRRVLAAPDSPDSPLAIWSGMAEYGGRMENFVIPKTSLAGARLSRRCNFQRCKNIVRRSGVNAARQSRGSDVPTRLDP